MGIDDSSTADINIDTSGLSTVHIACKKEGYSIAASGDISLPGQSKPGDCIHDSLSKYTVDLKSVHYDAGSDSIQLTVHKILDLKITLKKGGLSVVLAQPPMQEFTEVARVVPLVV